MKICACVFEKMCAYDLVHSALCTLYIHVTWHMHVTPHIHVANWRPTKYVVHNCRKIHLLLEVMQGLTLVIAPKVSDVPDQVENTDQFILP